MYVLGILRIVTWICEGKTDVWVLLRECKWEMLKEWKRREQISSKEGHSMSNLVHDDRWDRREVGVI